MKPLKVTQIISFFILYLYISISAQETHTYGPVKENKFTTWIKEVSSQPRGWAEDHKCGAWSSSILRNINYWTWTYNDIPTEATVTEVTIKFRAEKYSPYQDFHVSFHNIQYPYGSNVNFYNECKNSNKIYEANIPDDDGFVLFDKTFTQNDGSGVVAALNSAVKSGNYFFTLGIKALGDMLSPAWEFRDYNGNGYASNPAIDLTIKYETDFQNYTFINRIETNENYGYLKLNENISITSDTTIGLPLNSSNEVRTDELPFIVNWNSSGKTEKHRDWLIGSESPSDSLKYSFIANVNLNPNILKAEFKETKNAIIKNELEGGDGGQIKLKDPWFYYKDNNIWYQTDIYRNYSSPFYITNNSSSSYGGVFLGQGYNPVNHVWTAPYYSVKTASPQTININGRNHTFYFQNWEASPSGSADFQHSDQLETPVVFNNENATVKAVMKGTQLSNNINAFTNNSERKFVRTPDGNLHLVYESMGKVWIEGSSDNGNTWNLLNNGQHLNNSTDAKNPAIDFYGNTTAVVYQEKAGNYFNIKLIII